MSVEIVSHCWNYSRALVFQLSSLLLYPPQKVHVTISVFYAKVDCNTVQVLDFFSRQVFPHSVTIQPWALAPTLVTRRMTGRNLAALATQAEWVWFTDVDYVFREHCLDSFAALQPSEDQPLVFPRITKISSSHEIGDRELARVAAFDQLLDISPDNYVPKRNDRAIGGIQIVRGDVARRLGYCKSSRYQGVPSTTWVPNYDDVWFRRTLKTRGAPFDMPQLYRIRHSTRGGDLLNGLPQVAS